jgi:hypothetical protein
MHGVAAHIEANHGPNAPSIVRKLNWKLIGSSEIVKKHIESRHAEGTRKPDAT